MVLTSIVRHAATKRVPMIQFRKGGPNVSVSAAPASASHPPLAGAPAVSSPSATPKASSSTNIASGVIIEDWQLPPRYQRKPISQEEMDYINRGGPA